VRNSKWVWHNIKWSNQLKLGRSPSSSVFRSAFVSCGSGSWSSPKSQRGSGSWSSPKSQRGSGSWVPIEWVSMQIRIQTSLWPSFDDTENEYFDIFNLFIVQGESPLYMPLSSKKHGKNINLCKNLKPWIRIRIRILRTDSMQESNFMRIQIGTTAIMPNKIAQNANQCFPFLAVSKRTVRTLLPSFVKKFRQREGLLHHLPAGVQMGQYSRVPA
jgi:hypothetical protein